MGFQLRAIVTVSSMMVAACGLVSGLDSLHVDGGTEVDASPEVDAACGDGAACGSLGLPAGWTPVAYHQGAGCPDGYASQPFVAQPVPACSCSCLLTSSPSCESGSVPTFYGTIGCATTGLVISANNGNCTNLGNGSSLQANFAATPVGPTGGACTTTPVTDASATNVEACVPTCGDAICQGIAPVGFQACLLAAGSVPCPTGTAFTVATEIGTSATASCPACTCTASGTCSNETMSFFSDTTCKNLVVTLNADSTCQPTNSNGKTVPSVKYTAQVKATCNAASTGTGSASLVGVHTVCCKP